MTARVLSLPDWSGPGVARWQSLWERLDARLVRVHQASWTEPVLSEWLEPVRRALVGDEPTLLLGHGLGALLAVHAASLPEAKCVVGALLVAPPAIEHVPLRASFGPVPMTRLPFPATVIAGVHDPLASRSVSEQYAVAWGASLVESEGGHLDAPAGGATWRFGAEHLRRLAAGAPFTIDPRLASESHLVGHGALCELRLVDEQRTAWFLLVPRSAGLEDVSQLSTEQRALLSDESAALVEGLHEAFEADKINVGALGNVVRQLHVHHVVRRLGDYAWPGPVWGHSPRQPRVEERARHAIVEQLFMAPSVRGCFRRAP